MHFLIKVVVTALLVAGAAACAKRSPLLGSILVSLPVVSILAIVWLYIDTKDVAAVASFSRGIFWAVLPTLLFFLVLPAMLKSGMRFYAALSVSAAVMAAGYSLYAFLLRKFGVQL